jgi:flagellar motor protein MotB
MRQRWQARPAVMSHSDDWLMTYADVITLLLCFFAVFLSVSIAKQQTPHRMALPEAVVLLPAAPSETAEHPQAARNSARAAPPSPDASPDTPSQPAEPPSQATAKPTPATAPVEARAAPQETTAVKSATILDPPKPTAPPESEPIGDRIISLEMSSAAFFDSGSATLSKAGEAILGDVATQLRSDRFRDYQITVEGHTDDTPIHTVQFPSNWELSTARAAAVVHFFLQQGIPAQKLRAAGYADTFPKAPNRDGNGNPIPENQSQNRRVIIKLEKIEKAKPVTPTTLGAAFFPPPELR